MVLRVTQLNARREQLKKRLEGSNVSARTFLATDYLNHFNEVFMLLEMLPDMPEMIEDIEEWTPKSYVQHFSDSSIADKDLAVEAYELCPDQYRLPFDQLTEKLVQHLTATIAEAHIQIAADNKDLLRVLIINALEACQALWGALNAIIHSDSDTVDQRAIDTLLSDDFVMVNPARSQ
jgi:hypothetical protein